jgi:hypothetical protein
MHKNLSCFIIMGVSLLGVMVGPTIEAATIYLDIDTVFITSGVGTEFDLALRVDDGVRSLKLFVAEFDFDPAKLQNVSATKGTIWDTCQCGITTCMTNFGYYLKNHDSVMRVEGLVFGGGVSADGPGLLATIRWRVTDTGRVNLTYHYYSLKDVGGNQIIATTMGSIVFINYPPTPFDLVDPSLNETVAGIPGGDFDLVWESSASVYPGEGIVYKLQYGTSAFFDPPYTTTVGGLTDTTYTLFVNNLPQQPTTFYWRVTARGDMNAFETLSTPDNGFFNYVYGAVPPSQFDLVGPADSVLIDLKNYSQVPFDWQDATSANPGDTIKYVLYIGPQPTFPGSEVLKDSTRDISQIFVAAGLLPVGQWEYWKIRAVNKFGMQSWSTSARKIMFFYRGDANRNGKVNVTDATYMLAYMFGIPSGPPPIPDIAGDNNCSGKVNVSDVTFLLAYLFGIPQGPEPHCP